MKLYKYCSVNKNTIDCLVNRTAWYSESSAFNDPFDGGLISDPTVREAVESIFGILSLSKDHLNPIMWSHYADSHRGICLEFEQFDKPDDSPDPLENIFHGVEEELHLVRADIQNAMEVKYRTTEELQEIAKSFSLNPEQILAELHRTSVPIETNSTSVSLEKDSLFQKFGESFITKHQDWAYEQEWRILIPKGNRSLAWPGRLSAVYLGLRISNRDANLVNEMVKLLGVEVSLHQMERSSAGYGLTAQRKQNKRASLSP